MPTTLTVNGVGYPYPNTGDQQWGSAASGWALAVTNGMLQKAGGTFTLTADVNFGPNFGLISAYFTSRTANTAAAGAVRLANSDTVSFRNAANSADLALSTDGSNRLKWNGVVLASSAGIVPASAGGTGLDTSASTGFPSISAGTWSIASSLGPTSGGTGLSTYTLGDTLYASAANTLAKLAGNITATQKFLAQTGTGAVSAAPGWVTLSATDIVAGTLPEARGGTNQSTYTLGDLLYASAANTLSKLAGNTTTTKKFLTQTGSGAASAAPSWGTIAYADVTTFSNSSVIGDTPNGHGSTNTKIRRWTNTTTVGSDITYADSATLGMTLTINTTGRYTISYSDSLSGSACNFGLSLNSAQLTTSISTITTANRLLMTGAAASVVATLSVTVNLTAGDVIRTHTDGTVNLATAVGQFVITRVS